MGWEVEGYELVTGGFGLGGGTGGRQWMGLAGLYDSSWRCLARWDFGVARLW